MQIPILIEPIEGDRYRARAGEPFALSAEGKTKLEAFQQLEQMIRKRIRDGAELFTLEVQQAHPLSVYVGMFKDNPLFDEWKEAMAEFRRQQDADPEVL
jgi:hypothetical protein